MNSLKVTLNALLATAAAGLLASAPQPANGQICPGSRLSYIVRDQQGRPIAKQPNGFRCTPDRSLDNGDFLRSRAKVPDPIASLSGKIATLTWGRMCNFPEPIKIQLSLAGKSMTLIFIMPRFETNHSADFVVDSMPFQPGTFGIDLNLEGGFYPADGWKPITEGDEAFIDGQSLVWRQKFEGAVEPLKRALSLNPGDAETLIYLGYAYLETRRYDEAIVALAQVTQLNSKSAVAYGYLSEAYWLTNRYKETVEACEHALRLGPTDAQWSETRDEEMRELLNKARAALGGTPKELTHT
jgi:tetratricopeptide (TPR) repeat protein